MRRRTVKAASRICCSSGSDNVIAGATVMESPVCTPIASTFSIEHTMTQLSLRSRMTSSSNSFQPITDSSTSTSWTGEIRSGSSYAMPPPLPPSVNEGRRTSG